MVLVTPPLSSETLAQVVGTPASCPKGVLLFLDVYGKQWASAGARMRSGGRFVNFAAEMDSEGLAEVGAERAECATYMPPSGGREKCKMWILNQRHCQVHFQALVV